MQTINRKVLRDFLLGINSNGQVKEQINKNNQEIISMFGNMNLEPSLDDQIVSISPSRGISANDSPFKGSKGSGNNYSSQSPVKTQHSSPSRGDEFNFPIPNSSFMVPEPSECNSDMKTISGNISTDRDIYQNFILLLLTKDNGAYLNQEILGHFEFFMNTLSLDLKSSLENPFESPENYPAFDFKVAEDLQETLKNAILEAPSSSSDD